MNTNERLKEIMNAGNRLSVKSEQAIGGSYRGRSFWIIGECGTWTDWQPVKDMTADEIREVKEHLGVSNEAS